MLGCIRYLKNQRFRDDYFTAIFYLIMRLKTRIKN